MTCEHTIMKLEGIKDIVGGDGESANNEEKSAYGSAVGSLAWISRVCRLDILANVSKLQQNKKHVTKRALRDCNKVIKYARDHSKRGLWFKSRKLDWSNMIMLSITDASWSDEKDPDTGEEHRSLGGRITAFGTPSYVSEDSGYLHVIGFGCTLIHRVCRATLQAETYQLSLGVEHMDLLRAGVVSMYGKLNLKRWESTAAEHMLAVWFTDCDSTVQACIEPVLGKIQDKRLSIEISSLRQSVWRRKGQRVGQSSIEDDLPVIDEATDIIRWIDTDTMLADCLTKVMDASKLMATLESNFWDIKQPIESLRKKRLKQAQRQAARKGEKQLSLNDSETNHAVPAGSHED